MHRILTLNGKTLDLSEKANAEPTPVGGVTEGAYSSGEVAPTINSASKTSIEKENQDVNSKFPLGSDTRAQERANRNLTKELANIMNVPKSAQKALQRGLSGR